MEKKSFNKLQVFSIFSVSVTPVRFLIPSRKMSTAKYIATAKNTRLRFPLTMLTEIVTWDEKP